MDAPLLRPPARWADELRTLTIDDLSLSCPPRLRDRLPAGRSLTDVEEDLARGVWLVRRRGKENEFSIGGSEFELRVKSRLAEQGRHPIAQVLNVDEARKVPRRAGRLAPRRVEFHDLWDEALCDLAALEEELERRLALIGGVHGRVATQPELESHQDLHRVVRRGYSDLRTLINLLEQRPVKAERTITGVIAGSGRRGRRQLVVVETGAPGLAEFRGKRVSLRLSDGRAFNTAVTRVQERQLHIAEPQDWPGVREAVVEVAGIPPFGLRRNAQALEDFLTGRVEGAWPDLARLVCRPGELSLPPFEALTTFYCDLDPDAHPLNDEQRRAVTGAVMSPHGFLVQGPPGTGKTEVISETIQQLVGRGERVLLLAPTHVAVDEVLKRVGPKQGMRPLRITFDDDKVDEHVRAYLPQHVGVELSSRVLRPTGAGGAERWAAESLVVERQLAALVSARSTSERRNAAEELVGISRQEVAGKSERLVTFRAQADRERERARAELAEARQRHTEAATTDDDLARAAKAMRDRWEPLLRRTREAASALSAAARAEMDRSDAADNAKRTYREWRTELAKRLSEHDAGIDQWTERVDHDRQSVTDADQAGQAAAQELQQVEAMQGRLGHLASRVGLGQLAEARRALNGARRHAKELRIALQDSEAQLVEAHARRNRVDYSGRNWAAELRQSAERNLQKAWEAHERRVLALRRLLDALVEYQDPVERTDVPDHSGDAAAEDCGRLATAVLNVVDAVTRPVSAAGVDLLVEPGAFGGLLAGFVRHTGELWYAESAWADAQRALLDAAERLSARTAAWRLVDITATAQLRELERADHDARALFERRQLEATLLGQTLAEITSEMRALDVVDTPEELARLTRRRVVLNHLPALEHRWRELVQDTPDDQLVDDIQTSALRATNLVCATTKGIVGHGSDVVRETDYDTLIVDEASRVTDSEFLIGAVRARRWVLVGDEHQLPPHVDQEDEHFLHALFALHRHERGAAASVEEAVDQLAEYWQEDVELRDFRGEAVRERAAELIGNGMWESTFQARMAEASRRFDRRGDSSAARHDPAQEVDPDRELLRTMNEYMVRSLFERVVQDCSDDLKQALKWQRRMPEPLARIVNEPVYGGTYLSPPEEDLARAGARRLVVPTTFDRPAVFVDTSRYRKAAEDSPARRGNGFENELERRMILRACRVYHDELDRTRSQPITVSVLSFYRAQARALDDALDRNSLPLFDIRVVDVIDRIQGQQADLVVISFVRARDRGAIGPRFGSWLQDVRRLNVACTRARRALLLVGHADTLRRLGTNRDGTPRDANAVPAVNFYRNLFDLFDSSSPDFLMLHKLDPGRAG